MICSAPLPLPAFNAGGLLSVVFDELSTAIHSNGGRHLQERDFEAGFRCRHCLDWRLSGISGAVIPNIFRTPDVS